MSYGNRMLGSRVSVRKRDAKERMSKVEQLATGDQYRKVAVFDLVIPVGKGRKQAEELRVKVERALRDVI